MPPPQEPAELAANVTLVSAGAAESFCIPPPLFWAELAVNVTLVSAGAPPSLYMPPPQEAELAVNVTLLTVGALPELYMPPPDFSGSEAPLALPAVTVKPSSTAALVRPAEETTW